MHACEIIYNELLFANNKSYSNCRKVEYLKLFCAQEYSKMCWSFQFRFDFPPNSRLLEILQPTFLFVPFFFLRMHSIQFTDLPQTFGLALVDPFDFVKWSELFKVIGLRETLIVFTWLNTGDRVVSNFSVFRIHVHGKIRAGLPPWCNFTEGDAHFPTTKRYIWDNCSHVHLKIVIPHEEDAQTQTACLAATLKRFRFWGLISRNKVDVKLISKRKSLKLHQRVNSVAVTPANWDYFSHRLDYDIWRDVFLRSIALFRPG